jgi:rubrerythrin
MDAAQALLMGIDKERSSYSFYKTASDFCRDPAGQRMFASLADIELGHVRYLESLYSGLTSDGAWQLSAVEEVPTCPANIERPDLFPCIPEEEQKCAGVEDDLRILSDAIKRESDAREFYRGLASKIEDPTGKTVFEYLENEEVAHERILREAHQHLAETGAWHRPDIK